LANGDPSDTPRQSEPAANGGAQRNAKGEANQTLIQVAFPQQANVVFFAAILTGLALICLTTIFRSYFAVNGTQSNLVLCIGAALVLAAFGGQATVRVGGIIMAGVAAVALGLFVYLQHVSQDLLLEGTIHSFDHDRYESLDITQKHPMLGRINNQHKSDPKRSRYDFVIFKKEIDGQTIDIGLTTRNTKTEQLLVVEVSDIEWAFGGQRLEWELREETVGQDKILTLYQRFGKKIVARENVVGTGRTMRNTTDPFLISTAFAQETSPVDVPLMLARLKADDTATRRGARDALSHASLDLIPVIMDAFHREWTNYQVKLGVCVALAQMLRTDKSRGRAISGKLSEDDLNSLLDAAGDPDRTVRVYATEFLFDLGDTRTTNLAIRRAATTTDDNARYNWLFVAQDGWRKLKGPDKAALADSLNQAKQRSGANTLPLFEKLSP